MFIVTSSRCPQKYMTNERYFMKCVNLPVCHATPPVTATRLQLAVMFSIFSAIIFGFFFCYSVTWLQLWSVYRWHSRPGSMRVHTDWQRR